MTFVVAWGAYWVIFFLGYVLSHSKRYEDVVQGFQKLTRVGTVFGVDAV